MVAMATGVNSYYRARYYDPQSGRFINEDPISFLAGVNHYSYVYNNSPDLQDPSGLAVAVLIPSNIVPGRKLVGDLDALCRKGRNIEQDRLMLLESIATREREIEHYMNSAIPGLRDLAADPGHLERIELERETLARCNEECEEKARRERAREKFNVPDSWLKFLNDHTGEMWIGAGAAVGTAIVIGTGGAALPVVVEGGRRLIPAFAH